MELYQNKDVTRHFQFYDNHPSQIPTRLCKKCGVYREGIKDHWMVALVKPYGYYVRCKHCHNRTQKDRIQKRKQRFIQQGYSIKEATKKAHGVNWKEKVARWEKKYGMKYTDHIKKWRNKLSFRRSVSNKLSERYHDHNGMYYAHLRLYRSLIDLKLRYIPREDRIKVATSTNFKEVYLQFLYQGAMLKKGLSMKRGYRSEQWVINSTVNIPDEHIKKLEAEYERQLKDLSNHKCNLITRLMINLGHLTRYGKCTIQQE